MSGSVAAREPAESCPLCDGSDRYAVVMAYDRMRACAADYRYVRCATCGLLALSPQPTPADIAALYPPDYYAKMACRERNLDKPANRLAIRYYYGVDSVVQPRWLRAGFRALSGRILNGIIEPRGGTRLLDVGCGTGATLALYQRLGWQAHGIEPSPQACASSRARGLTVHQGTVFDAPFGAQFDVVLLSHVIEHVLEPIAVLRRAAEFLAPGGTILLHTPNARGLGFALYRSCWFALDAPRHLCLFDPRTIRLAGDKAGLRARRIATGSTSRMLAESRHYAVAQGAVLPEDLALRTELVGRAWRQPRRSRWYRDATAPLALFAALTGRGDLMEVEFAAARS